MGGKEAKKKITRRLFLSVAAAASLTGVGRNALPVLAQDARVLKLPLARASGNLDPQRYVGVFAVQDMIFDPLVDYVRGGKIEPALAESWTISDDAKVFTFKLRPNVTFSDGEPWNAEAMKWNLERWIPKENYNWLRISANFEKLEVIDPMTVAIHFKESTPTALVEFSYVRPVRFLSPKSVAEDGSYKDPIGTGPWKIEKDAPEGTDLVPNEKYWGEKSQLDRVSLVVIPDARSRMSALRAGDIDASGGSFIAAVSPQDATTLKSAGMTVITDIGTDTMILGFNPRRPLFQDQKLREAINLLIDREAICKALLKSFATPTVNLYPEVIAYSGKRFEVPKRDVEKAKMLLDEAGWKGEGVRTKDGQPLNLDLVVSEDAIPGSRSLGEVLQNMLAEAGVGMTLRNVDHAARHGDIPQFKYDISLFVTNGAPYDPFNSLQQFFLTTLEPGTDGHLWEDKQLDPLILAAVSAPEAGRAEAFQKAYDFLHDGTLLAPLYHQMRIWAHNDRIKTFVIPPTEYEMPLTGLSLK
jgi:nickel transport system substrate-binding protein